MKRYLLSRLVLLFILSLVLTGCGNSSADDDIALPMAAYQYAKGEVQVRLEVPNSAVFPSISEGGVEITEIDKKKFEIKGYVAHRKTNDDSITTTDYTMVVLYEGKGLWSTESLDLAL